MKAYFGNKALKIAWISCGRKRKPF